MARASTGGASRPGDDRPASPDSPAADATREERSSDAPAGPCYACRGTGAVISNLGGTPSTVTCPWCDGGGVFLPGHDAQSARREQAEAEAEKAAETEEDAEVEEEEAEAG